MADGWFSWSILAAMALVFELGKWCSVYDQRRWIAGLLITVSVLGSAGGLHRALTINLDSANHIDQVRELVSEEIKQNNQAIATYLTLDRIRNHAQPLQQRNAELRDQLANLPQPEVSELASVLSLLANVLNVPTDIITGAVILLLAGLLDTLGVLFMVRPVDDDTDTDVGNTIDEPLAPKARNLETLSHSYPAFKKMQLSRRDSGKEVLSQRACIREGYRDKQVRGYFQKLVTEGIITKNGGQYDWPEHKAQVRQLF
ncbi:hypothetical protein [Endozoicomonas sp. ONNA2]|uniref:hypothetical protein n=1 Tax=Endozoicomonas sp. ONNA2 TaxID=2828741 RepID=UPI0021495CC2|nr:hypothetical protein [Endozoicomonas sp. ONNA2]